MTFDRGSRRMRAAITFVVLAAALLLQGFGLMHRIAHAPRLAVAVHATQASHATEAEAAKGEPKGLLASLFGTHDSDTDCQLFDQLTHVHLLVWAVPPPVAALPPHSVPRVHRSRHLAAQSAGYLARGPPRLA